MKPRELRRQVMIKARMRVGASWNDVCILNISQRGLSMQAADPPPRGTYLEICRGQHRITARVIWSKNRRFGAHTQDCLPIEAIIHQPDQAGEAAAPQPARVECRRARRTIDERHDRSRLLSRWIQFALVGTFAASAALATFGTVAGVLHHPLAQASDALAAP